MRRGDTDAACELFAESVRLDPAPGARLNLADCDERRGRFASARQEFADALAALPSGDDRIAFTRERIASLAPRVPTLVITASGLPDGAEVLRDGARVARPSLGQPIPVDPGRHELRVRGPGFRDSVRAVTVGAGERNEVALTIGEPMLSAPPPPPASRARSILPYGLLGGGAAALAAGSVLGVLTLGRAQVTKEHCSPGCDAEGYRAAEQGRWMSVTSPVLLGAAVALVGAGLYLLVSLPAGRPQ
ncbi:MAG: hypothetical protein JWP97_3669 [Labilithrix sp.]|nr:hypothetical protein [Labilithrix sp.]